MYEKASIAKRLSYQSGFNRNKPQFQPAQSSGTRFVNQKNTTQGVEKEKKTCWYCKEPWNYQHKCKVGKVVHMMEEVEEEEEPQEFKLRRRMERLDTRQLLVVHLRRKKRRDS